MELITKEGYSALQQKRKEFREEVDKITERIKNAREDSPELSENKEYIEALEDQARLDKKMLDMEEKMAKIRVIDISEYSDEMKTRVKFGCTVKVLDCDTDEEFTFKIVGVDEVDTLSKDKNAIQKISYKSPVGSSLLNKEVGDEADVVIPNGERVLEIIELTYV